MSLYVLCKSVMVVHTKSSTTNLASIVSAKWVPKELIKEHKHNDVEICQRLLDRYKDKGEGFSGEENSHRR